MGEPLLQTLHMHIGGSYTRGTSRRPHSTASRPCSSSSTVASTTQRPCPPRRAAAGGTTSPSHLNTTTTQSDGTLSTLNLSMDQLVNVIRAKIGLTLLTLTEMQLINKQVLGISVLHPVLQCRRLTCLLKVMLTPFCRRCSYHCS